MVSRSEPAAATIVMTTLPDSASAVKLANRLVESRSAACVHVLPAGRSIYRWNGKIEESEEVLLLIKTSARRYEEVERAIREGHCV